MVLVRFGTGAIVLCASSTSPDLPNQHLDRDVAGICDVLAWVGCPRFRGAWQTTCARATTRRLPCFCSGDPTLRIRYPADIGQLAARSVTQAATARAIDRLNRFQLQVLDAVVVLPEPVDG